MIGAGRRSLTLVLALLAVLALLVIGIVIVLDRGSDGGGGPAVEDGGELAVTVWTDGRQGGGEGISRTFSCVAGSTEPVCEVIAELTPADFAPTPGDVACTEIYGGPAEARVAGTLRGVEIDAAFSRVNGCEIERFERMLPLLGLVVPEDELLALEGP